MWRVYKHTGRDTDYEVYKEALNAATNKVRKSINVWNKLSTQCVHASSVNMFNNRIDKYLVKASYT